MMLECMKSNEINPFIGAGQVLAGYRQHMDVTKEEVKLLRVSSIIPNDFHYSV
jgi:hypothetical protein